MCLQALKNAFKETDEKLRTEGNVYLGFAFCVTLRNVSLAIAYVAGSVPLNLINVQDYHNSTCMYAA